MDWLLTPAGLLGCYLLLINLLALCLMGWDKRQSKRPHARRIPERRLFAAALLGGSIGSIAGMFLFHHKTRHWYFRYGLPAILLLQAAIAWLLWRHLG